MEPRMKARELHAKAMSGRQTGSDSEPEDEDDGSWKELEPHRDEAQVELDVNRSFVHYPSGTFPSLS